MKLLVTGATGLLGNNVARSALEQGHAVRTLVRTASDPRPLAGLDFEPTIGDVTDASSVRKAAAGVDAVVHCAAHIHIGWRRMDEGRRVNVDGTRHVVDAAREAGARLIHVSTVDTLGVGSTAGPADEDSPREGKPACCYVVTKREAEQVVLDRRDLDAVVIHPGFMLGPWDWKPSSGRMLLEVTRRWTPATPAGGCSVCDVRDVAAGILAAIEWGKSGRRYILAGENLTYFDLWSMFADVAGRPRPRFRMSRGIMPFIAGTWGDLRTAMTGHEPTINSAMIEMSKLHHFYSSRRAIEELGYSPRPAREAVEAAWTWFHSPEFRR